MKRKQFLKAIKDPKVFGKLIFLVILIILYAINLWWFNRKMTNYNDASTEAFKDCCIEVVV